MSKFTFQANDRGGAELMFSNSWGSTFSVKFIYFQRMCFSELVGTFTNVSKTLSFI